MFDPEQYRAEAFRTFEITPAFQEQYGYPALTPETKRRILGHNAIHLLGIDVPTATCAPAEVEGLRRSSPAANRTLGVDRGLPFPLSDLNDGDVVMLLGSNMADTMPPAVQHLSAVRQRGGLIVVDPRRSATARLTEAGAGEHREPRGSTLR